MIDGHTRLYGFFAHPAAHSKSPLMHNTAFQALGINARYLAFDVVPETLAAAIDGLRAFNMGGVNLSMPLKEQVLPLLDDLDPAAKLIGAVNTIANDNGHLTGYNTDGLGLLKALAADFNPQGAKVVLLGAGGAIKSVAVHCALAGAAEITIFNRHIGPGSRAHTLQQLLTTNTNTEVQVFALDDLAALKQALNQGDLLVNGTGVGMGQLVDQSPIPDSSYFQKQLIVFEMIYVPEETLLLQQARKAGLTRTYNGLGMLIHQGAAAFHIWTGQDMPVPLIEKTIKIN
ncbi:MAG: shikimate dehydrogenase [Lactobacillus sp.]|nr:shikimate dehydrogenase [Lactobacillus sp.]